MDATTETALARWFGGRLPASGAIEPAGLLALAEELAARPDLWSDSCAMTKDAGCTRGSTATPCSTPG